MDWSVYQQFIGMAQSLRGYKAQTIYVSAMNTSFGPLARLIDEKEGKGLDVCRTCVFDVMEHCDGADRQS